MSLIRKIHKSGLKSIEKLLIKKYKDLDKKYILTNMLISVSFYEIINS